NTLKLTYITYGTTVYGARASDIAIILRYLPQQDISSPRIFSQSE
ncbi:MAG: hypothetical protein EZS28_047925, partial [Streblomastix strix]